MAAFLYSILQKRSTFFYLLFLGYLGFIHPWLMVRLSETSDGRQIDRVLGWFLIILLFLELWGFWLKHPIMVYYGRRYPANLKATQKTMGWVDQSAGCTLALLMTIFLPIFHLGMASFLYIIATQVGGLDLGGQAPVGLQLLYVGGFFLVIIKEAGMIGLFYSPYGLRGIANDTYPTLGWRGLTDGVYPSEIRLEHLLRDALGDLVLWAFAAVAYTVLWDFIGLNSPIRAYGFGEYVFEYLGVGFYFLMTVLPLQSVYLFQAVTTHQTKSQRTWMVFSFLILAFVAMLSFPRD